MEASSDPSSSPAILQTCIRLHLYVFPLIALLLGVLQRVRAMEFGCCSRQERSPLTGGGCIPAWSLEAVGVVSEEAQLIASGLSTEAEIRKSGGIGILVPQSVLDTTRAPEEERLSAKERSHSPDPSVWSLKSDMSMKMPIQLKDEESASDQRYKLQIHDNTQEIQQRLKSYIKRKHQYIFEGLGKQGNPTLLNQIYTELYIIEEEAGGISNKHEFTRIEKNFTAAGATIPIQCSDIFRALPGQDKPIRTVLTKGVAGIGKTVSVQKFILDWAEGKENQDVQLIFPLPFREINLMKDKKFTLVSLLQTFLMKEISLHLIQNSSVVLIFDGLDECRLPLNFNTNETLQDVTNERSVDVLLTNLIVGNLLPSALIWITSRPAAADLIPSECVHRVTEVRGFNEPQKQEYFRKRIGDQSLANTIISHLKSSRSLFIMCHIPVFCWISAAVLEKMLNRAESGEIPNTLTQMYTHFLILQTNIKHEKDYEKNVTDEDMIFKLGKVAFQQLVKGNLIFYEEDLRECGIDVTEASVYSGLCSQIFRKQSGLYQGKVFSFVHLSVQEHLAALYVHLSFNNSGKNVLVEDKASKEEEINDILKCAVVKTLTCKNGYLDLFLRFLMGLSMESNQALLERFLNKIKIFPQDTVKIIKYLKEMIKSTSCPETSVLLFHCLNELNDHSLTDEIQRYITSGKVQEIQSQELGLALMYILMTTHEQFDEFELAKYGRSDIVLAWLHPVIKLFTKAWLHDCNITKRGCLVLSTLLSSLSSVRELDLSNNSLQDAGVEILSVGIKNSCYAPKLMEELFSNQQDEQDIELKYETFIRLTAGLQDMECILETLNLKNCGVTEASCVYMSKALSLNPSHLKVLDLSWNNIGDSGVKHLCAAVVKIHCALETIRLDKCGMTERSCTALASALSSKTCSLTHLDLSINDLQDSGVKKLSAGLQNPHCTLEKLRLSKCNITHEGVTALTEALKSNPSHLKGLDLSENDLEESDLKVLSIILDTS
ncbi:NACHT, LRR and PYD domains-containing protein 14-like [Carassius auratus]|uniref:NACHT, LRR and PYD domains-containing protein 14-like n=1 Tax=Carassius auratus TaxID=7957 RepID=A0A6P6QP46_CARAU|nr:NACHT, LRR and PYD domains-containing protein 14-like [Carassius auratus]